MFVRLFPQSQTTTIFGIAVEMTDTPTTMPTPSDEELEDVVYAARYGDLDDVRAFIDSFGASALAAARDESGNTVLHMAAANGHTGECASLLKFRTL